MDSCQLTVRGCGERAVPAATLRAALIRHGGEGFWGGDSRHHNSQLPLKGALMDILKNLSNLIKVKTLVTLAVMTVFCTLALRGTITADNVDSFGF